MDLDPLLQEAISGLGIEGRQHFGISHPRDAHAPTFTRSAGIFSEK
jgi:hypothetical protein